MAEQTFQLRAGTFSSSAGGSKTWSSIAPTGFGYVNSALSARGTGDGAFLRSVGIFHRNGHALDGQVNIQLSPNNPEDFTAAVETNGIFTLASGSHSVDFGILGADTSEPYAWVPDNSADIIAFHYAIGTSNVAATLTIRDGPKPSIALAGVARAGTPKATATGRIAPHIALAGAARAGSPSATGTLRIAARLALSALARAGVPVASATGRAFLQTNISLAGAAQAGSPSATATGRISDRVMLSGAARAGTPSAVATGRVADRILPVALSAFARAGAPVASASGVATRVDFSLAPSRMVGWALFLDGVGSEGEPFRVWSGEGDLEYGGETWNGTILGPSGDKGALVQIGPDQNVLGSPARRTTIAVAVPPSAVRRMLEYDAGPIPVTVDYIYSEDSGRTWQATGHSIAGRLSRPRFEGGIYSVEVETYSGDVDRGTPRMWSDEAQKQRDPTDKGFEFMRQISQGVETKWPP